MKIKDPIHGYIEIDKEIVVNIVDTAEFQRLREVRQTNYDGLYPGSLHNRFTHSLGVYFLGKKTSNSFFKDLELNFSREFEESKTLLEKIELSYCMACLLHDVGHAPFSHSCEKNYLDNKIDDIYNLDNHTTSFISLYNELYEKVCEYSGYNANNFNNSFYLDYKNILHSDALFKPHEAMSAIIGMESFNEYLKDKIDFELFTRCIIGCLYEDNSTFINGVKNCLIKMLNSPIVDVDKLDYLMRDMKMTGFLSSSIDLDRLLDSFCLIEDDGNYCFGFKKNVLSALMNVLITSDNEKKWIQSHPVIIYESYLFDKCIEEIKNIYGNNIFTKQALSIDGIGLNGNDKIRLLSDSDVLYLLKKIDNDKFFIKEFFSRKDRKKPVWKNEVEFNIIFNEFNETLRNKMIELFTTKTGNEDIKEVINLSRINDELIEKIKKELESQSGEYSNRRKKFEKYLFWCNNFKNFCKENDIEFEIINIQVKNFVSSFEQLQKVNPLIKFPSVDTKRQLTKIDSIYIQSNNKYQSSIYFYLYISKNDDSHLNKKFVKFFKETAEKFQKEFNL